MNAEKYPPINLLSIVRGFHSDNLKYHINPIRFEKKNGEVYQIDEIRHFHQDRKGRGRHYHYVVHTKDDKFARVLFDTNTFAWRLFEVKSNEVVILNK
jgi:hypothetical protein